MEVLSRGGDGRRTGLQRQFEFKINRHVPNLAGRQTACVVVETVVCRAVALRGTLATWRKWLLGKGVVPRRAQLAPPGETFGLAHRSRKFPRRAEECTPSRTGPCRCSMIDCAFPCPCHCCILIVLSSIFEHNGTNQREGGGLDKRNSFLHARNQPLLFRLSISHLKCSHPTSGAPPLAGQICYALPPFLAHTPPRTLSQAQTTGHRSPHQAAAASFLSSPLFHVHVQPIFPPIAHPTLSLPLPPLLLSPPLPGPPWSGRLRPPHS